MRNDSVLNFLSSLPEFLLTNFYFPNFLFFLRIKINSLFCQYVFTAPGIKSEISKTGHAHNIAPLNTEITIIGQYSLQLADKSAAAYHHDQEAGARRSMFSKSRNSQRKNARP